MKKTMVWILTLMLCLSAATVQAAALPQAARIADHELLERYPSYALDAQSGKWSVRANAGDALIARFWEDGGPYADSLCVFVLEAEGNVNTGVMTPVLRLYYRLGQKALNVSAVSLLADGVRYDFAASSQTVRNGRANAEVVSVPLTQEGFAAVRSLSAAQTASVRLVGEKEMYTTALDVAGAGARKQIESASLTGLESAAVLLDVAGFDAYALWDLSAAAWEKEYGFAPAFESGEVSFAIGENETTDAFGMVALDDRTKAAAAAQQALIDAGFMSGTPKTQFDDVASAAARRAQHFYGLIETGCVDAKLLSVLAGVSKVQEETAVAASNLADMAEIALNRYWFAGAVSAHKAPDVLRSVANTSNVLLAADGSIRNLSLEELRLFMHMEAQVVYNDNYAYEAVILCERDQGAALDTALVPLAHARLIVYAEVPAYLAQDENAQWKLTLIAGEQSIDYELQ